MRLPISSDVQNYYPSKALLNIHTTGSPSPSSSDIGYQSLSQPSSPSDCGSEFTKLCYCLNNTGYENTSGFNDSGNKSNEVVDSDVKDAEHIPVAKKTTLVRLSKIQLRLLCLASQCTFKQALL